MNRREFLKGMACTTAWAVLPGCASFRPGGTGTGASPNIVYILADDLGYGDVSALNEKCAWKTRHIDRLAREGMVFTDAHSGSAVCTPTRYGVLTGRYCWRTRLKRGVLNGYSAPLLEPGRMTVASLLRRNGYTTACIGKWHLGVAWARSGPEGKKVDFTRPLTDGPVHHGFDYSFIVPASLDMGPYVYVENDRATAVPTRTTERKDPYGWWRKGLTADDFVHEETLPLLAEKAAAFIEGQAKKGGPFFLYLPLTAPHTPILPTKEFQGKSGINPYGDFVLEVDHVVGRVLAALDGAGVSENTLVVFTSDNGCSPQANFPVLAEHGHHPSYVFRGHKADIFEGGHRIPFLARWPGRVKAGAACDETICLTDLLRTCAGLLGEKLPEEAGEDSYDLTPLLLGRPHPVPLREATVHHSINGSFSIRQGKWKLELCPGSGGWSRPTPKEAKKRNLPPVQLYDLTKDVSERKNLYAGHPEVVARLKALLAKYVRQGRSTPGVPRPYEKPGRWPGLWWMDSR